MLSNADTLLHPDSKKADTNSLQFSMPYPAFAEGKTEKDSWSTLHEENIADRRCVPLKLKVRHGP